MDASELLSYDNCLTIDSDIVANPSCVGTFERETIFCHLPNNAFTYIIFEGAGDAYSNPNEIERVLNKKNLLFCLDIGTNEIF